MEWRMSGLIDTSVSGWKDIYIGRYEDEWFGIDMFGWLFG